MNYTEEQLKKTLAKMLPEICYMTRPDNKCLAYSETGLLVLDTELLHLCWMVEHALIQPEQCIEYMEWIGMCSDDYGFKIFPLVHASWQQRVEALAKVKGIEI